MFFPRTFSIILTASLVASAAHAQAGAPADPVSGAWSGKLGAGLNPTTTVRLDLKLNGTDITGTLSGLGEPGDVRRGTYDPASGALRLELGITGQEGVQLVLEGTAIAGTAVGSVKKGTSNGSFVLTRGGSSPAVALPEAAAAPATPATAIIARDQLRNAFDEITGSISKAAALVPAEKYNYRPTADVRTFGELVGHVADAYRYYCAQASGRRDAWSDAAAQGPTDRATVTKALDSAAASCAAAHAAGNAGPLIVNMAHANLHYGNMVTYMRMLGIVPPTSR
jgi:uncharacterized damage-inducible protein DinB